MTKNLKYFSGIALILSVIFFINLYSKILIEDKNSIWIIATLYGMAMFISGLSLGYKDSIRKTRQDLGFKYHLVTFIIVNSVGIITLFISNGFNKKTILDSLLYLSFWSLGLIVHYYYSSKSIKGMDREEIFD